MYLLFAHDDSCYYFSISRLRNWINLGQNTLKKIAKKFVLLDESEMGFSIIWIISSNKFEDEKRKEK